MEFESGGCSTAAGDTPEGEAVGVRVPATHVLGAHHTAGALACGEQGRHIGPVVSNHGGRTVDSTVAPIDALPEIAQALRGKATVLMDSGVRRGSDVLKALALGADAVAMGTRFASSLESPVHAATKDLIVAKQAEDTIYSRNFDTWPCRVMRTPGGQRHTARRLSPPVALGRSLKAARELQTPLQHLAREALSQGVVGAVKVAYFGAATLAMRKAIQEGNHDEGVQLIGQSQGLVHDVASVADIIARTMAEAAEVRRRLAGL